jgi:hypothetical protein
VDHVVVISTLGALAPIVGGILFYLRHRDRLQLVKHVYDATGAQDAAAIALALSGKAHPELRQRDEDEPDRTVDEPEKPKPLPPPAGARKRRRRRPTHVP